MTEKIPTLIATASGLVCALTLLRLRKRKGKKKERQTAMAGLGASLAALAAQHYNPK